MLADFILDHFGKEGTVLDGFRSSTQDILGLIAQKYPREIWRKITKYLGPSN